MTGGPPAGGRFIQTAALMGTVVTIEVIGRGPGSSEDDPRDAVGRAFEWFRQVEASCSRFDPDSELMQVCGRVGEAVPVSATLFHAAEVALAVAAASHGAFDPTVGARMMQRGFNRNYRTGITLPPPESPDRAASFRDVRLDARRRTIRLARPLLLDLGAVAKGLAVDLAAQELAGFENYVIDAGGDLYLAGRNQHGEPWRVGIRHPRDPGHLIGWLRVSSRAVCTSGDYERPAPDDRGHHIIDPRSDRAVDDVASVTVVAPAAVLADALATAVFVLGVHDGLALLHRHRVDGLIVTASLEQHATRGMHRDYHPGAGGEASPPGGASVLYHAQGTADDRPDDPGRARRAVGRARPDRPRTS